MGHGPKVASVDRSALRHRRCLNHLDRVYVQNFTGAGAHVAAAEAGAYLRSLGQGNVHQATRELDDGPFGNLCERRQQARIFGNQVDVGRGVLHDLRRQRRVVQVPEHESIALNDARAPQPRLIGGRAPAQSEVPGRHGRQLVPAVAALRENFAADVKIRALGEPGARHIDNPGLDSRLLRRPRRLHARPQADLRLVAAAQPREQQRDSPMPGAGGPGGNTPTIADRALCYSRPRSMHQIRTYNTISVKGLERFPRDAYAVASELPHPDALLIRSQKLHDMDFPDTLKAIGRAGAGVNNVPLARCSERGVVVFNAPGANANAVKELVLAGMLLGSRDIYAGMKFVESLAPQGGLDALLEREKKRFAGAELMGKTLGVVGLGNIGSLVANMGLALGMKVVGYDPAISIEAAWRLSSAVEKMDNLASLFARAEYVSLHLPALDTTRGLIDAGLLAGARSGQILLNFARGEIVDTLAIVRALNEGRLHRYVSDFPANDTLGHPRVVHMPHIGASTGEAEENCAVMVADQLMDFLEHGNIRNSVNFPNIELPRTTPVRLTVSNRNVPKVLNNITGVIAQHDINIVDMLNKSRGDLAYNIIDLEACPASTSLDALRRLDEVISLRVIGECAY